MIDVQVIDRYLGLKYTRERAHKSATLFNLNPDFPLWDDGNYFPG